MFCPCCRQEIDKTEKPVPTLFQTEVCSKCHAAAIKVREMHQNGEMDVDDYLIFEEYLQNRIQRGIMVRMLVTDPIMKKIINQLKLLD